MPRVNIFFSPKTYKELKEYLEQEFPGHKAQSLIVQKAVREFLERQRKAKQNKEG